MKPDWINRAIALLDQSLNPVPTELNEIDWKEKLSPNKEKLKQHLVAFSNSSGGGFLVFGIRNKDANIVGVSKEDVELIIDKLASLGRAAIEPEVVIDYRVEEYNSKNILIVFIKESDVKPVHFRGSSIEHSFIRSGGTTRPASRQEIGGLMLNSKTPQWEELSCSSLGTMDKVLSELSFRKIAELAGVQLPNNSTEIIRWLVAEKMIKPVNEAGYYITNFGAISAANDLKVFDALSRKAVRVIKYKGTNKVEAEGDWTGSKGYAVRFERLIEFISSQLPSSEVIKQALRTSIPVYPPIAIRELVANALIHQDFTVKGAGPMIEIFDNRIEISNPGQLLPTKKIDRLIGTNPESRNEILASAFRRFGICEERGSGFQKAVAAIELFGLPPLRFVQGTNSFKVIMYSPKTYAEMDKEERLEAVYQHSVLQFLTGKALTSSSLRKRLKMSERQRPQVSLLIKEALEAKLIQPKDPNSTSRKFAEYIPYYAA
jgi:predicted HTH transcriptional regulator